jgi:predicted Zn-dependent protease
LDAPAVADGAPTRFFVERARRIVFEEMKRGAVSLRLSGSRGLHDISFTADVGCPAKVELVPGKGMNAWADGERVVISAGLLEKCVSDNDLALVIAHELAHNLLHHSQRLASARSTQNRLFLPSGAGSATMRETEEEADRRAVTIAIAAGYDLREAESFLSGLMANMPGGLADTHPAPDRRMALLRAAIAADSESGSTLRQ